MLDLRCCYEKGNENPDKISLRDININVEVSLSEVYDTTKALLYHGADINYQLEEEDSLDSDFLKRRDLDKERFGLVLTSLAIFTLEECFKTETDFHNFNIAIEPLVTKPMRKIVRIAEKSFTEHSRYEINAVYPHIEESKVLWPLIDKWESTEHRDDLDLLQTALEAVVKSHRPTFKKGLN